MANWELKQGDCYQVLQEMPDSSIDLIITSPPYADRRKQTYGGVSADVYVVWFLPIAHQLLRVLKPTGSFVLNIKENTENGERSTYVYELVIALRQQGWKWIDDYCWHKKNSAPGKWPTRFRDGWEHCYHFTRQLNFKMNQDAVMVPASQATKDRVKRLSDLDKTRVYAASGSGIGCNRSNWVGREMVYPDNILYLQAECRGIPHSAPYPVELPAWFIRLLSDPGDLVLDPFAGSGTTLIAATRLGRKALGIELVPEHCELARQRIIDDAPLFNAV